MNFSHRSRYPQNVPNIKDEVIQRQFERFERIRVLPERDGSDDAIISKNSRALPCTINYSKNRRIANVELLGIHTLQSPFDTVESSRGSPRAALTGTINQDLINRLDEILDNISLSKSVQ